jgi:16S rRNA (cytosine1402-N4)-methyltransferase
MAPLPAEIAANPRARSAKLRTAIRTAAPARGFDEALARRARLPALASGRT